MTLLIAATCLAVVASELALRVTDSYAPFPYPPIPRWTEQFGPHDVYGYALHPNRTTTFEYPPAAPRATTIHANSDGFRQTREFGEPSERTRVLVVGDSFTYGVGVEEEERFTDLVEERDSGLRLDNAGIPGWGPDLMLLAAEAVADRADPEILVVALFEDDFRRVRSRYTGLGFMPPRFHLVGDSLVLRGYPRPTWYERTHLWEALMRAVYGEGRLRSLPSAEEWRLNERILDRFGELGKREAIVVAFVYLAGRGDSRYVDRRLRWLREYAAERGAPMLDLTSAIRDDTAGVFLPENDHYSPLGHDRIAGPLSAFLDSIASTLPTAPAHARGAS